MRRRHVARAIASAAVLALAAPIGCLGLEDDFRCTADENCARGDEHGLCETTGYCAFADASCPWSRRRYGDHAAEHSGECVVTGSVYWVAPDGDDSAPGTEAAPFLTITRGVSILAPGDVLLVRPGEYTEAVNSIPPGRSWGYPVTVASYPRRAATLRPPSVDERALEFSAGEQRYIVVSGFVVDGSDGPENSVHLGGDHVRIEDCEIVDAPRSAVSVSGDPGVLRDNQLVGLDIHGCGLGILDTDHGEAGGIAIASEGNLVEHCSIHDNNGGGIGIWSSEGSTAKNVIRKNSVHDQGPHEGFGIYVTRGEGTLVYDNVVRTETGDGIIANYDALGTRIFNNTSVSNGSVAIVIGESGTSGTIVTNNIAFSSSDSGTIVDVGVGTQLSTNIETDPIFLDLAGGDLHLRSESPGVDTGEAVSDVPDDFEGVARPQGGGFDIGAYERAP